MADGEGVALEVWVDVLEEAVLLVDPVVEDAEDLCRVPPTTPPTTAPVTNRARTAAIGIK